MKLIVEDDGNRARAERTAVEFKNGEAVVF
jgi:hypothetical protein